MKKLLLILMFVIPVNELVGCSCNQSLGNDFLNQVENFDAVVIGKFQRKKDSHEGFFLVKKILKGIILADTISIHEGGTDCTEIFIESNIELIVGLNLEKSKDNQNIYSAPSCVASVLKVNNNFVISETDCYNLHIRRPKINFFSKEMKLKKLVRKVKNRL